MPTVVEAQNGQFIIPSTLKRAQTADTATATKVAARNEKQQKPERERERVGDKTGDTNTSKKDKTKDEKKCRIACLWTHTECVATGGRSLLKSGVDNQQHHERMLVFEIQNKRERWNLECPAVRNETPQCKCQLAGSLASEVHWQSPALS